MWVYLHKKLLIHCDCHSPVSFGNQLINPKQNSLSFQEVFCIQGLDFDTQLGKFGLSLPVKRVRSISLFVCLKSGLQDMWWCTENTSVCWNRSISCNGLTEKCGSKRSLESDRPSFPPHSGLIHDYILVCSHLPFLFLSKIPVSLQVSFSELSYCYHRIMLKIKRLLKVVGSAIRVCCLQHRRERY